MLTAFGAAGVTVALLAGATVLAISPGDEPYTSEVLNQGGLHPGVVLAVWALVVLARTTLVEVVGPLVVPVVVAVLAGALGAFGLFGRTVFSFDEASNSDIELAVPVPWLGLVAVVAGTLAAAVVVTSTALLFLRPATDVSELRV